MYATLSLLRSNYGSVENYIMQVTSLTSTDISLIRRNLLSNSYLVANNNSVSDLKAPTDLSQDQGYAASLLAILRRTWLVQWILVLVVTIKNFTSCLIA